MLVFHCTCLWYADFGCAGQGQGGFWERCSLLPVY